MQKLGKRGTCSLRFLIILMSTPQPTSVWISWNETGWSLLRIFVIRYVLLCSSIEQTRSQSQNNALHFSWILKQQLTETKQWKNEGTTWIYILNAFYDCWRVDFLHCFLGQKEFNLTDFLFPLLVREVLNDSSGNTSIALYKV